MPKTAELKEMMEHNPDIYTEAKKLGDEHGYCDCFKWELDVTQDGHHCDCLAEKIECLCESCPFSYAETAEWFKGYVEERES